jgi:hypothetical protein
MKPVLVICAFCVFLTGCVIYDNEIEAARKACEPHGGAELHTPTSIAGTYDVICKSKTKIKGNVR